MTHPAIDRSGALRVLLLDDSEIVVDVLRELLAAMGVDDVRTASNGREGLAVLDAGEPRPNLLVCDLGMPEMDGIEFLRHVSDRRFEGDVILMSATDTGVLMAAERLAKAHGFKVLGRLEKPVDRYALGALLARSGFIAADGRTAPVQSLSMEEIRAGLAEGRIELRFQPKISIATGRVSGVECLARWRHDERGLLDPGAFIAEAESSGLIDELTLQVFRKAVEWQARWLEAGRLVPVSINVAMDNLMRVDLPEVLQAIVIDAGLETHNVVLEITESRLMGDLRLGLDVLIRLRLKGFGLSIDDFGTGYSTMETLKQLPFSELKVDKAFTHGAADDRSARAILASSVRLAREFSLLVVAEGVETRQDWDVAAAAGCDEIQGYFVARPMAGMDVPDWIEGWDGKAATA